MKIIGTIVIIIVVYIVSLYHKKLKIHEENLRLIEHAGTYTADFSTPEGAILCLENAYREKNIEKAINCKDFKVEAMLMLKGMGKIEQLNDDIINKTADTLKLSFHKHTIDSLPNFDDIHSYFVHKEKYDKNVVVVTEIQKDQQGLTARQRILVAETENGWRVISLLD